ncbi:MAG: methylenetetrahydrofolate reductase [Kiritimatiellia bacterium]
MHDLPLSSLLSAGRPLLSYEFFPPKSDEAAATLRETIHALVPTAPDFVTVTYGAGGSTRARSSEVVRDLVSARLAPVVPHLTCVGSTRVELAAIIGEIHASGRRNIMCLRGDPPKGQTSFTPPSDGLNNALELTALLKELHPDLCCGVAGYPETHPEAVSRESEMPYLARKVAAGASFITTQLFFDNAVYFDFVARCRAAGITVPILPGLLPISSLAQTRRFSNLCSATLPERLVHRLELARRRGGGGRGRRHRMVRGTDRRAPCANGGAPGASLPAQPVARGAEPAAGRPLQALQGRVSPPGDPPCPTKSGNRLKTTRSRTAARYLMTIKNLLEHQGYARVTDIARRLNITRGSCSLSLKPLKRRGLVVEDENRFLLLSDEGRRIAGMVEMNDRIIEEFFAAVLGVDADQAEVDACKIEHLVSIETSLKLRAFLLAWRKNDAAAETCGRRWRPNPPPVRTTPPTATSATRSA